MNAEAILAAVILAPLLLLTVLRINAALVFLSLCLGDVLMQFVSPDGNTFISFFVTRGSVTSPGSNNLKLFLLLLPAIATALFMVRTVKGAGARLLNILPAAGVGLLAGLLVVPLLPGGLSFDITSSPIWSGITRAQTLVVSGSALVCLLMLWLQRSKSGNADKHGKH